MEQLTFDGTADRQGIRGGTTESLEEAQGLYDAHRHNEKEQLRAFILRVAYAKGEVHADDCADLDLSSVNMIGAQINALAKSGLLQKLNARGAPEHRKARAKASHGRASYVWSLTMKGEKVVESWRQSER